MDTSDVCKGFYNQFRALTADVNVYDIFGICWGPEPYPQMIESEPKRTYTAADYTPFLFDSDKGSNSLPPCTFGNPILDYYGR